MRRIPGRIRGNASATRALRLIFAGEVIRRATDDRDLLERLRVRSPVEHIGIGDARRNEALLAVLPSTVTIRSGSSNGGRRSNIESMTLKIAVFTLIPRASVNTAVMANVRLRASARTAKRRSLISIENSRNIGQDP